MRFNILAISNVQMEGHGQNPTSLPASHSTSSFLLGKQENVNEGLLEAMFCCLTWDELGGASFRFSGLERVSQ